VRSHHEWKAIDVTLRFRTVGWRPAPPIRVPEVDGCDILAAHGVPLCFEATGAAYGRPGGAPAAGG